MRRLTPKQFEVYVARYLARMGRFEGWLGPNFIIGGECSDMTDPLEFDMGRLPIAPHSIDWVLHWGVKAFALSIATPLRSCLGSRAKLSRPRCFGLGSVELIGITEPITPDRSDDIEYARRPSRTWDQCPWLACPRGP